MAYCSRFTAGSATLDAAPDMIVPIALCDINRLIRSYNVLEAIKILVGWTTIDHDKGNWLLVMAGE
jgi:hypothetical protein